MRILVLLLLLVGPVMAQPNIEYFLESKLGPERAERCEDGILYNEHYLVVVDGASDKSGKDYDGHTGGWICKETILGVFKNLNGGESREEIVDRINQELRRQYERYQVDYLNQPEHRFSAVLIWYSFADERLNALGDCKARIDGELYNDEEKTVDRLNSEFRVQVLRQLGVDLKQPLVHDYGRDYILPLLKYQSRYQNNLDAPPELGYWVIDGTDVPAEKIRTWQFEKRPQTIELSSDGYAEFPQASTVAAYEQLLKELLEQDPSLTWRVKSTKGLKKGNASFDDRSVLIWKR